MRQGQQTDVPEIRLVPVDAIRVLNPRERNKRLFEDLITSIAKVGLKKPITVVQRPADDGKAYDLVCGQGRLEAFMALGEVTIPAQVIDVDEQQCLIMSLVENLARRNPSHLEQARAIYEMSQRGIGADEISRRVGVSRDWVSSICTLFDHKEDRLIQAVEAGRISISIARLIAGGSDSRNREILAEATERGELTHEEVERAKQILVRQQKAQEKSPKAEQGKFTADRLLKTLQKETTRHRLMIKKAEIAQTRLTIVASALRTLLGEPHFMAILRAEGLLTLPAALAEKVGLLEDRS